MLSISHEHNLLSFANDSLTALQIVIPIRIVGHPTRPSPARTWSVGPTRPPAATVATGTSSALRSLRHHDRRRLSPPWRPGVKERGKRMSAGACESERARETVSLLRLLFDTQSDDNKLSEAHSR